MRYVHAHVHERSSHAHVHAHVHERSSHAPWRSVEPGVLMLHQTPLGTTLTPVRAAL